MSESVCEEVGNGSSVSCHVRNTLWLDTGGRHDGGGRIARPGSGGGPPTGTGVRSLAGYDAVVLGAPLYIGSLLKDARRFMTRHAQALGERPWALFVLGPTLSGDEEEWQSVRAQLEGALQKMPQIRPVTWELFGGRFEPSALRFPDSLLASLPASPLHGRPASDLRDWEAIDAWAEQLVTQLGAARA